jgi:S-DNA-T family DNA segregation ATPase FtsK/SpoIIIE
MVSRARPVPDRFNVGPAAPIDAPEVSPAAREVSARTSAKKSPSARPAASARLPQKNQAPIDSEPSRSARSEPRPADEAPEGKRHEVLGLVALALAVFSALALASYDNRGGRDWAGPAGTVLAEGLIAVLGTASVIVPLALLVQSIHFFRRTTQPVRPLRVLGTAAIVLTIATALHLAMGERPLLGHLAAGGLVGISTGETLRALLGTAGAHLVVLTALLVALVVRTRLSVVAFARATGRAGAKTGHLAKEGVVTVARAWQKARHEDDPHADIAESARLVSPEARVESALSSVLETQRDAFDEDLDAPEPAAAEQSPTPASAKALFAVDSAPERPSIVALDEAALSAAAVRPVEPATVPAVKKRAPRRRESAADSLDASPAVAPAVTPVAPALASLPPIVVHSPSSSAAIAAPMSVVEDDPELTEEPAIAPALVAAAPTTVVARAQAEAAQLLDLPASPSSDAISRDPGPARRRVRRAPRAVVVEGAPLPPVAVAPVAMAPLAPKPVGDVAPKRAPLPMPAARAALESVADVQPTPPATQPKSVPPPPLPARMSDDRTVNSQEDRESLEPLPIVSHDEEIAAALETPPEHVAAAPKAPIPIHYDFPPVSLLTPAPKDGGTIDEAALRSQADRLVKTLRDYQIEGEIAEIHPGPVVTTFEFVPSAGTKLARIAARSDDIAMSLAVNKVRIVAPIPGKGRVGFEIPNPSRKTVFFRELVDTEAFGKLGGALPVALGKDVVGAPFFSDLAKMPHLIVAGATGQGKSVGLNVMLCSMLFKRGPEEVRMLMIDPKMVELAVYDGIPHMLLPVVTDMKKAAIALRWVVDEMERRYSLFAQTGSRNIISYNERVTRALHDGVPMKGHNGPVRTKHNGTTTDVSKNPDAAPDAAAAKPTTLPYIVVVVDEFADLMMVAGKEVEAAVARLAQKARAAGIHVILATQRPSVDVITGMIKANFPSRVGFKVTSKVDSRTILDQQGAENLLGMGDMLILPPGSSDLRRVHCAFVSEDEVQAITDHWRKQGTPTYDEEILRPRDEDEENAGEEPEIKVPMEKYEKAIALVLASRRCSVSWIQRQLAIGYNVAARIVERMEREGIVSAPKGPGKDREVLG